MVASLNISGLNGLTINPNQFGVELGITATASGTYTVPATTPGAASGNLSTYSKQLPQFEAGTSQPVKLIVTSVSALGGGLRFGASYPVGLQVQQSPTANQASVVTQKIHGHYAVIGWNADSILLTETPLDNHNFNNYLVISGKPLTQGNPSDPVFGTTGAPPVIDGVTFTLRSIACFAGGTRISTVEGLVAVEHLQPGDLVRTASGAVQPIIWVGMRHVRCAGHAQPARVTPVCIAADAFGPGLPVRDLHLSPEHAVFVDGALVPAHALVNGTTIRQAPVEAVTYYHIELPQHDVVLAEGLPAESYLDTGSRLAAYDRAARAA